MNKIGILSHVLPPSPSGQAVVLYRLLREFEHGEFCLLSSRREPKNNLVSSTGNSPGTLNAKYIYLPEGVSKSNNIRSIKTLIRLFEVFHQTWQRAQHVKKALQKEGCAALIGCSGDLVDIPAGFLASKMAHIPFYAYIFDDYIFQWTGNYRKFAKLAAPIIFKHSAGVIGPNEYICEEYQRRYDISTILIRNPCDENELKKEPYHQWPSESRIIKILFTGAIYHANYGCFLNLIKAMDSLTEYDLELHIFTAQTIDELEAQGIKSNGTVIHSHIPYNEILELQRKADILFLPLAFDSPIPEAIRTSAPGKMGEYLASGRPVLAHVPEDSFVAYYFKIKQCGWVADQNDPIQLASKIKDIITNQELRSTYSQNALHQAKNDFSPDIGREQLLRLLRNP